MDDFENEIPVTNLKLSQGSRELRVKTVLKKDDFIETRIERHKINNILQPANPLVQKTHITARPQVHQTICLSIEDVKNAKPGPDNCWKIYNCLFRKVCIYGKLVNLNTFSKNNKTCHRLSIDDGTEEIIATMNVTKEAIQAGITRRIKLTTEKNKLRRIIQTGINIKGQFHQPESEKCREVIRHISVLHNRILNDISNSRKDFHIGPIKKKGLIHASLYHSSGKVQLNVFDISLDDNIELVWKRHLNKLYTREYLKKS